MNIKTILEYETFVWYNDYGDCMKIRHIKKMRGTKYKLTFMNGEEKILEDQVIIDYNLLFRKELDLDLLNEIEKENNYYEMYSKVMKYLIKKKRCKKELYEYMNKYEIDKVFQEKIINKFDSLGLIDEYDYAKSYTADKLILSKDGPNKIRRDLINLGIRSDIIDDLINNVDQDLIKDKAYKLIDKRIRTNKKYSTSILIQKITNELIDKGYDKKIVKDIIGTYDFNNDIIIEKEYNKQYLKLSRKYDGYELRNKIKEKLYQKGFSSSDINKVIERNI